MPSLLVEKVGHRQGRHILQLDTEEAGLLLLLLEQ